MIELLSKPIDEIGTAEIQALIDSEVPEGEQIEFKKEPPAEGGKSDPWMNDGKIGNYAKDRILKEVVAFANAYGGVLVIGIDESDTKPAVATRITTVPRCVELAESLKLVFRDRVEPQLARVDVAGIQTEGDGSGVVVIRVGKSRLAPHRVTRTLVCSIRRADRSEEMTMREVQDMTLNVSRGLLGLKERLSERSARFHEEFSRIQPREDKFGIRLTAVPVADEIGIDSVFRQGTIVTKWAMPRPEVVEQNPKAERYLEAPPDFPSSWRTAATPVLVRQQRFHPHPFEHHDASADERSPQRPDRFGGRCCAVRERNVMAISLNFFPRISTIKKSIATA